MDELALSHSYFVFNIQMNHTFALVFFFMFYMPLALVWCLLLQ